MLTIIALIGCNFTMTSSGSLIMKSSKENIKEQASEILNIVKENNKIFQNQLADQFPEMRKEILEGSKINVRRIQGMNDDENDATIILAFSIIGSDMEKSQKIIDSYEKMILPVLIRKGFDFEQSEL